MTHPLQRLRARCFASSLPGFLAVAALAAATVCGCGRGDPAAAPGASAPPAAQKAAKAVEIGDDPVKTGIEAGDAGLAGRVRSRLAGDPQLRALPIEVDAEGGRVTVWGHVGNAADRTAIEQLVRRTPGVTGVTNLIKLDAPSS